MNKKKTLKILGILVAGILVCATIAILAVRHFRPVSEEEKQYRQAVALQEEGRYVEAREAFKSLVRYQQTGEPYPVRGKEHQALTGYKDSFERLETILLQGGQKSRWFVFGSYETDNDLSNGKEMLTWNRLVQEEDRVLLICASAIDCRSFHETDREVTWADSSLRKWLNGPFLKEAFTAAERKRILDTRVTAEANPSYGTSSGKETTDKVFLLSVSEYEKYIRRFPYPVSAVARAKGLTGSSPDEDVYSKGCIWWLRTSGKNGKYAAISLGFKDGDFYEGLPVSKQAGVVPAVWVSTKP